MARKQRRPQRPQTFLLKHTRKMIEQIKSRLPIIETNAHSEQQMSKVKDMRSRIQPWPRNAAGVSKEKRAEIRKEGGRIIFDFNRHLSDLDGNGPVLPP